MEEKPEPVSGVGEAAEIRPFAYRLRGENGGSEVVLPLADGLHRLGSGTGNDLVLGYEGVSRKHALVLVEPGKVEVFDRASKNGTFVDGRRVRRSVLQPGSLLAFGPVELVFEVIDPDDALLALRLTPEPSEEPRALEIDATTAGIPSRWEPAARWLGVATDCLTALQGTDATAGQALARVCSGLGAEGAAFSFFSSDGVEILAAFGPVEASLLSRLHQLWLLTVDEKDRGETRRFFLSRPQAASYIASGNLEGSYGLTVTGYFQGREASLELLRMLLTLLVDRHTQDPPSGSTSPGSGRRTPLVFPPGYIEGRSRAAMELFEQMEHLVLDDLPVLIVGETGVGKELVARILHDSSLRSRGPLVAINCAAIPTELLEAELFGIGDRVATGVAGRRGKLQEADGGTLLLDEIAEMPVELQAKLLRVLQEGLVEPVGAPRAKIDVRILSATNSDIRSQVEDGRFRQDLFFRLAGYVLEVPPLRRRREDIPLFVEHLIRTSCRTVGKSVRGISVRALRMLTEHHWPGNIRELENQIRRLVYFCPEGAPIDSALVSVGGEPEGTEEPEPASGPFSSTPPPARSRTRLDLQTVEREVICEALRRAGGNQVHAARLLDISRYSLRRRIHRHRISLEELLERTDGAAADPPPTGLTD